MFRKIVHTSIVLIFVILLVAGPAGLRTALAEEEAPWTPALLPGTVEGVGVHFEVTDSDYLNVTLDSSAPITLSLSSFPSVVELRVAAAEGAAETQLALSGLVPNLEYHLYTDSLENHSLMTADEAGGLSWVQDLLEPHVLFLQTVTSTKYIADATNGKDCTKIGTWDDGSNTCTLTQDVADTIVIQSSGLTLDGNGFTLSGSSNQSQGVLINGNSASKPYSGITVKNLVIQGFRDGIALGFAQNCNLTGNVIDNVTRHSVNIWPNSNNYVGNNQVILNTVRGSNTGIYVRNAKGNQVRGNLIDGLGATSSTGINLDASANVVTGNQILNTNLGIQNNGVNSFQRNTIRTANAALDGPLGTFHNNNLSGYQSAFFNYSSSQSLSTALPFGGNYWSGFDTLDEGCADANLDGFCDISYVAVDKDGDMAGQDLLPWMYKDGWLDISFNAPLDPLLYDPEGVSIHVSANTVDVDEDATITSAVLDWGDGTTSEGTISSAGGGVSSVDFGQHTYYSTGVYELKVTVVDAPYLSIVEAFYRYIVIYDPSAGFVTGGGWIDSPEGAYVPNPSLTGQATFGFIAKFYRTRTGAADLSGSTVFEFHAAGLRFTSTAYDFLVVNNNKAIYRGVGIINGDPSRLYGFMLTAIDDNVNGDKFRMQIWDGDPAAGLIYDNMIGCAANDMTAGTVIGSGSIIVQTSSK